MARRRGLLTLAEAIHKITDYPARRFQVAQRGRIAPGYFADLTVFNASTVDSPATYEEPEQSPIGIQYVFRNGKATDVCAATH